MVVEVTSIGAAYFPVPKVACTSLKAMCYELQHGKRLGQPGGDMRSPHKVFPTPDVSARRVRHYADWWTFAVVRDPVQRLLSAYSNRVEHHGDPERAIKRSAKARLGVKLMNLSIKPDVSEFFSRLHSYRFWMKNIRHHTDDHATFLGPDIDQIDSIYKLEDIDLLLSELRARSGNPSLELEHRQSGGTKIAFSSLDDATKQRLLDLTKRDYDYLGGLYRPPTE